MSVPVGVSPSPMTKICVDGGTRSPLRGTTARGLGPAGSQALAALGMASNAAVASSAAVRINGVFMQGPGWEIEERADNTAERADYKGVGDVGMG